MEMKVYVLDTGFFVLMRSYYFSAFPSFWREMDLVAENGTVVSVAEALREIKSYGGEQQHLLSWIKRNKNIFYRPSEQEQAIVGEIFNSPFKTLMSKKQAMKKDPFADPFVIAKAKVIKGTVVTREKSKGVPQGIYKIPDVCQQMGIECITPEEFFQEQEWKF